MNSIHIEGNRLCLRQLFNEQHALSQFQNLSKSGAKFNEISFQNVGIKVMREALRVFNQENIEFIEINYNWNDIMMMPKLVCYDKNKWTTLQQLANWNKQWNQLFALCYSVKKVHVFISISWMDQGFVKSFLEGLTKLPNFEQLLVSAKSKDSGVDKMLNAFQQANIFPSFQYKFAKID